MTHTVDPLECILFAQSQRVISCTYLTLAKTEIIYPKNVGALVAMNFTSDKYSAPRAIEKMKILGALLELPAKQHRQSSPFTSKPGQIGQINSTV